MKGITKADFLHAKRVCKDFEKKNLVNIISDALLLVDVFENFRKMSLKIPELNPVRFLSAPELIGKQL